jgi:hypothetical protein
LVEDQDPGYHCAWIVEVWNIVSRLRGWMLTMVIELVVEWFHWFECKRGTDHAESCRINTPCFSDSRWCQHLK